MAIADNKKKEKDVEDVVEKEESEYKKRAEKAKLPYVEMQVHYLNQRNMFGDGGSIPKNAIQQFVEPLRDKGYELINTHYIGTNEEGIGFAFVFVLK